MRRNNPGQTQSGFRPSLLINQQVVDVRLLGLVFQVLLPEQIQGLRARHPGESWKKEISTLTVGTISTVFYRDLRGNIIWVPFKTLTEGAGGQRYVISTLFE
jgi:hypothetical protein